MWRLDRVEWHRPRVTGACWRPFAEWGFGFLAGATGATISLGPVLVRAQWGDLCYVMRQSEKPPAG